MDDELDDDWAEYEECAYRGQERPTIGVGTLNFHWNSHNKGRTRGRRRTRRLRRTLSDGTMGDSFASMYIDGQHGMGGRDGTLYGGVRGPRAGILPSGPRRGIRGARREFAPPMYYHDGGSRIQSAPNLQGAYTAAARMPGGFGGNPYAYPPAAGVPLAGQNQRPVPPVNAMAAAPSRPVLKTPGLQEIPMGMYSAGAIPSQAGHKTASPVSKKINRSQPENRKVGPSGQEWIEGEDPWLDACVCTTNCDCRKGVRVLFRSKAGGDNNEGEIRYILKDQLGRDCGDHSNCRNDCADSDGDVHNSRRKTKKEGKGRAGKKDRDSESSFDMQEVRERMAEIQDRLDNMKPLGRRFKSSLGGLPGQRPLRGMMDGWDTRWAHTAAGTNPLALGMQHSPHAVGMDPRYSSRPSAATGMGPIREPWEGLPYEEGVSYGRIGGMADQAGIGIPAPDFRDPRHFKPSRRRGRFVRGGPQGHSGMELGLGMGRGLDVGDRPARGRGFRRRPGGGRQRRSDFDLEDDSVGSDMGVQGIHSAFHAMGEGNSDWMDDQGGIS